MNAPVTPTTEVGLPQLLLVEDSLTTATLLSRYLANQYRITHAHDGQEAWDILEANTNIELVITDIQMPRMSGHQLLVKIRKSDLPRIRSLPVVVMTTTDDNVDRNLAFLNGASDFVTKPIDELEIQARVRVHYSLSRTIRELEESRRSLAEQASTDPLTQLKNRRAFFEAGQKTMSHARRTGGDVAVLLADIDYFKKVNDRYGHQAGDEALTLVGGIFSSLTRAEDTAARVGGEEFAILLPDTNRLGAAVFAERIRSTVEKEKFLVADKIVPITLSIGMATRGADRADTVDELINVADRRLYLAKQNGRNRICVNDEGKTSFAV
jgi:diguanylate cyclase (GGDEF)-like protein